ncbi:MAG: glutathione S-transferase family protein [Sphingomonadales bacterium]|nr:glutathione S-transferase family protein [Sphingomonadales bacterium]MBD3773431.1 glutathione S-transferase family protein [Paracoccaceae bacterium]
MSMIDPNSPLEVTTFEWVPPFARGLVRDLRVRWACEEIALPYSVRLIGRGNRPDDYLSEQPWGQVPVLRDGDSCMFESGAMLLWIAEREGKLLPAAGQDRARALSWLFAAFNSVEPLLLEYVRVRVFNREEPWAKARMPSLDEAITNRLAPVETHLAGREWIAGAFSIADIAMVHVLLQLGDSKLVAQFPAIADYCERAKARPAYRQALADQLAAFDANAPQG